MSFLKKGSPVEDLFSPAQEYDQLLPHSKKIYGKTDPYSS